VAGSVSYGDQYGFLLLAGIFQNLRFPLLPVHRVICMLSQIG